MCKSLDGINVVVASYVTGALNISSNVSEYTQLNNLLNNIEEDSVVVLATQNMHERYGNMI